jgi:hypothetical protein
LSGTFGASRSQWKPSIVDGNSTEEIKVTVSAHNAIAECGIRGERNINPNITLRSQIGLRVGAYGHSKFAEGSAGDGDLFSCEGRKRQPFEVTGVVEACVNLSEHWQLSTLLSGAAAPRGLRLFQNFSLSSEF